VTRKGLFSDEPNPGPGIDDSNTTDKLPLVIEKGLKRSSSPCAGAVASVTRSNKDVGCMRPRTSIKTPDIPSVRNGRYKRSSRAIFEVV